MFGITMMPIGGKDFFNSLSSGKNSDKPDTNHALADATFGDRGDGLNVFSLVEIGNGFG